jgi:hypothetical protein
VNRWPDELATRDYHARNTSALFLLIPPMTWIVSATPVSGLPAQRDVVIRGCSLKTMGVKTVANTLAAGGRGATSRGRTVVEPRSSTLLFVKEARLVIVLR